MKIVVQAPTGIHEAMPLHLPSGMDKSNTIYVLYIMVLITAEQIGRAVFKKASAYPGRRPLQASPKAMNQI